MKTATQAKPPRQSDAEAYEAWYDDQVRLGLEDLDAGRVVSHEDFIRRSDAQLRQLERKHAKAA